ncbi:hypothetical protein BDV95DRAFT_612775 [Massariosphaeria phaeospora]|uniref:Short-chain dehydrogenase n=1 Tax=Massariosphaeria phaeospora TaxID=100035 RepID=A0A7C8I1D2_9PLEO|nr:hypothetical protein BDV95DRAFT_612775 [Massariosphaeria phaeospora]
MPSRYADAHKTIKGPGDARPTALQIVQDENLVGKLSGKVALVTGTSSGIGIETAKALKAAGMHVFGAVRDLEKGKAALKDDLEPGKLELLHLDMNSLASVRACAKEFLSKSSTLNILVNNAGIMACPEARTADGFESQFGVNHLAHFLLFSLLRDTLLASATPALPSRVVAVSSMAHRWGTVHFDNLALTGIYKPNLAYGQSKTANVWFANELQRRYAAQYLHAFSLHPGGIWSGLQKHTDEATRAAQEAMPEVQVYMKSAEQGAATQVWAALAKELEGKGGLYLENCDVAPKLPEDAVMLSVGYAEHIYDEEKEKRLWEVSEELVGLKK